MATSRVARILSDVVDPSRGQGALPQRLVAACALAVPVTGVGMVLMNEAGPVGVVSATDGPAAVMEELQFTLGEGPCVDSSRTGRPVLVPDLEVAGPRRWPAFSAGSLDAGIRAIFAFPLRVGAIRLGVLDLYRDVPGVLSTSQLAEALSYADAATAVLLHLQSQSEADGADRPVPLIEDRAEVHQATGFVSARAGVSMPEALVRLRARAYSSDRPIGALAIDVLSGAVVMGRDDDDDDDGR